MKQETITLAELRQTELYRNVRKKLMKQEPVAWVNPNTITHGIIDAREYKLQGYIPLYTEPQYRDLTDEEIKEVSMSMMRSMNVGDIDFARAILKTARGE